MSIIRRWQCGFESRSSKEFTGGIFSSVASPRSGAYSNDIRLYHGTPTNRYFYQDVPATRQIRAAYAGYKENLGTSDGNFLVVRAAAANLIEVNLVSATDDLELVVDGVQKDVTIDSPVLATTWQHFGLDCKIDNAAGWAYVYLNGVEILSFDGNTGNSDVESVRFGSPDSAITGAGSFYVDDCYIDDTTGEGSSAVCPLLRFEWIYPDTTGNYDQWIGSDGNNVDNYLLVDERPPGTADYVEEDTVDEFDSYAMTTYALGAGEQIDAVIPIVYAQRYGANEEIALGTRFSGADVIGSDQDPGFGAWSHLLERQTAKPGGGAWTQAALDAVEVVIKSRGTF